jgi:hypothetical protein
MGIFTLNIVYVKVLSDVQMTIGGILILKLDNNYHSCYNKQRKGTPRGSLGNTINRYLTSNVLQSVSADSLASLEAWLTM